MFKHIQRFHKIVGLVSIIVVLFLVLTGLFLNHREELSLYDRYPANSIVLWLYGNDDEYIEEPPTWERVLTAFHGGRFFGRTFNLFVDTAGVILISLALTGSYIWLRRSALLKKKDREIIEEEALIEKSEQLMKVRSVAKGLHAKAGKLHDISEHVMEHIKGAYGKALERNMGEIEGHLRELDSSMHALLTRIERMDKEASRE